MTSRRRKCLPVLLIHSDHVLPRSLFPAIAVIALLVCLLPGVALASESWGIVSDTHIGVTKTTEDSETTIDPSEELADGLQVIVDKTEGKNRQAVFNLGDVTNKGVDEDAIDQYLDIIATYGEASKTPYHQVIGNHDLYNFGRYETSTDIAARTLKVQQALSLFEDKLSSGTGSAVQFYSFDHVNFILIGDTSIEGAVDGNSLTSSASIGGNRLSDATRESLNKRLLQTVRQGKIAIVMCHYPYCHRDVPLSLLQQEVPFQVRSECAVFDTDVISEHVLFRRTSPQLRCPWRVELLCCLGGVAVCENDVL